MKIELCTEYVENIFIQLKNKFQDVFKNRDLETEFVNNPFSKYLICYLGSETIGFLNYTLMYDRIEIININIEKKYQKKGYASLLMEKLIKIAHENDVYNITLEVNKDNKKAIHLYKKYDFIDIAIRKGYYSGTDGILMERRMK